MRRIIALWSVVGAVGSAWTQPLPVEVQQFYRDWNQLVLSTTLEERRALWRDEPSGDTDARLASAAEALRRIRARWVQAQGPMPVRGWNGFAVWSLRLEVASVTWRSREVIEVGLDAYPTEVRMPTRSPPVGGGGQSAHLGLAHIWSLRNGAWIVKQALGVLTSGSQGQRRW